MNKLLKNTVRISSIILLFVLVNYQTSHSSSGSEQIARVLSKNSPVCITKEAYKKYAANSSSPGVLVQMLSDDLCKVPSSKDDYVEVIAWDNRSFSQIKILRVSGYFTGWTKTDNLKSSRSGGVFSQVNSVKKGQKQSHLKKGGTICTTKEAFRNYVKLALKEDKTDLYNFIIDSNLCIVPSNKREPVKIIEDGLVFKKVQSTWAGSQFVGWTESVMIE